MLLALNSIMSYCLIFMYLYWAIEQRHIYIVYTLVIYCKPLLLKDINTDRIANHINITVCINVSLRNTYTYYYPSPNYNRILLLNFIIKIQTKIKF